MTDPAAEFDGAASRASATREFTINLYEDGDFASQRTIYWCVGASMQMMLNILDLTDDDSRAGQERYMRLARSRGPSLRQVDHGQSDAAGGALRGAGSSAWARGLVELRAGGYREQAVDGYEAAIREAAVALRRTGRPVGLIVWRGAHAWVMSGFTAAVGSVARTDLISPDLTEPLARQLYRALRYRILALPAELPVYPTHGAGSFCSAPGGGEQTTTIGRERTTNPLVGAPDEDTFVRRLLGGLGTYPDYFLRLREVNRRGPTVYGERPPVLRELTAEEFEAAVRDGAELVDARPVEAFAEGHIPGALSIALRGSFASWLGWLVPADRPLVFVLDEGQDRSEVVRQALKIGYEHLAGELAGGMAAWRSEGRPEVRIDLVRDPATLRGPVLDVRQAAEYAAGHLPDAIAVELGSLSGQATDLASEPVTVMCGHGERAATAASLLDRAGGRPSVFVGGADDWSRALGRPLATGV